MSFRLTAVFYVFAVLAAGLATFGAAGGLIAAGIVLGFWGAVIYGQKRRLGLLELLVGVLFFLMVISLLLPAVQSARGAARGSQCANNLKQISIALLNYHDTRTTYPPAYVADAAGKPMHSWRVLVLPFLEQLPLYQKYNMNEPWDGPNNSKLAAQIPYVYRCPTQKDEPNSNPLDTNYFVVVGPETVFPGGGQGRYLGTIADGTSKTIAVIEASGLGVHWMEPRDLTIDEAVELLTTRPQSGHRRVDDGFLSTRYYETSERWVAFCDGHVLWMGQLNDAEIARALLTAAGGEPIVEPLQQNFVQPKVTTVVKWGMVWGLGVFVALAVLPAWMRARKAARIESDDAAAGAGEPLARGYCAEEEAAI